MIYPEIRVPIPDMGGYTRRRGSVVYSYVYIGDRQTTTDGGTTHPKSKCMEELHILNQSVSVESNWIRIINQN